MDLYTWAISIHIIGAVLSVGTVTVHDLQLVRAIGDGELGKAYQKSSYLYGKVIQTGLVLLVLSGAYFMYYKPVLWGSEKMLTKLGLVAILIINGFIINFILKKKMDAVSADDWDKKSDKLKNLFHKRLPFDAISISTWYSILFFGAVGRQNWNTVQILIGYLILVIVVYIFFRMLLIRKFKIMYLSYRQEKRCT